MTWTAIRIVSKQQTHYYSWNIYFLEAKFDEKWWLAFYFVLQTRRRQASNQIIAENVL